MVKELEQKLVYPAHPRNPLDNAIIAVSKKTCQIEQESCSQGFPVVQPPDQIPGNRCTHGGGREIP